MPFDFYDKLLKVSSLAWKYFLSDELHLGLRSIDLQNLSAVVKYPSLFFW